MHHERIYLVAMRSSPLLMMRAKKKVSTIHIIMTNLITTTMKMMMKAIKMIIDQAIDISTNDISHSYSISHMCYYMLFYIIIFQSGEGNNKQNIECICCKRCCFFSWYFITTLDYIVIIYLLLFPF